MHTPDNRQHLINFFLSGGERLYKKRRVVINYSDSCNEVYMILKGSVDVVMYSKNGARRNLFIYKEGEFFPIMSVFANKGYNAGLKFIAHTDLVLRVKSIVDVKEFFEKNPNTLFSAVDQLIFIFDRVVNLYLPSAEGRLAHYLQTTAIRFGCKQEEMLVVDMPMTIQEMAENVRLSREVTGRILKKFEEANYIIIGKRRIIIYPEKLQNAQDNVVV